MAQGERVEVKTKAAAEKAIKAGKPVRIVGGKFALAIAGLTGVDIQIAATAQIDVELTNVAAVVSQEDMWTSSVVAWGSSSVVAWGSSRVEAWESSSVVARESSRVVAWGSSRVEAWESSSVEAWESSSVVAWESSSVVAWESSSVVAWESSRVEARESSRVVAWESSSVVAWESSSVVARESSRVEARESSRVVAWESSSVVAWGSSSVVARGYSTLQVHKPGVSAKASATVFVNLWHGATCDGGRQQEVSLATPLDWCEFYGARVEDGCAIVYKAVGEGYMSERGGGVCYAPGTMPSDPEWDGRKRECSRGGGLNFSPTPRHTHRFVPNPKHYLECRIRLDDDFAVHFDGQYPDKCCHRAVAAPLVEVEVDVDGNPIEQEAA